MCNSDEGFFNFTSRRPRRLLQILELGYNVMYNDVDMVWLVDPFPYLEGNHDVYFMELDGFFEQQFSSPASSKIVATPSRSPTIGSTEKRETRDSVSEREKLFGNRRNTNFPTINFKIEKVRKLTMRKRREGESALHHCLQNQNQNHRLLKISL